MLPLLLLGGAVAISRLVRSHQQRTRDPVSDAVEALSPSELTRFSTSRIHAIETLGRENDVEARRLLARLALDVEPLMKKHGLEVTALLEMAPAAPHLTGTTGEQCMGSYRMSGPARSGPARQRTPGWKLGTVQFVEIQLALRRYEYQNRFHSYDTLLEIVLRGLAFNTYPDKSPDFWRLVGRYEQEMEEIKRSRAACERKQSPVQRHGPEGKRWASFGILGAVMRRLEVATDLALESLAPALGCPSSSQPGARRSPVQQGREGPEVVKIALLVGVVFFLLP